MFLTMPVEDDVSEELLPATEPYSLSGSGTSSGSTTAEPTAAESTAADTVQGTTDIGLLFKSGIDSKMKIIESKVSSKFNFPCTFMNGCNK